MKKSEKWMLFAVLGALGIVGLCLICVVGAVLVPMRWWSQGGAAGAAKDFLGKSAVVRAELGTITEFGSIPVRSESIVNGKGTAHITVTIHGERAEGTAELDLTKESGKDWKVIAGTLTVDGRTLPLEGPAGAPATPSQAPSEDGPPPPNDDQGSRDI